MKKVFFKIAVAAIFMGALLVNVSMNASKGAKGTQLFELVSDANAACESSDYMFPTGSCSKIDNTCWYGGWECNP